MLTYWIIRDEINDARTIPEAMKATAAMRAYVEHTGHDPDELYATTFAWGEVRGEA